MANSVDPDQIGAVCSGSKLFVSILSSSVMLGTYLQQATSADDIFRCIFFCALKVNLERSEVKNTQVLWIYWVDSGCCFLLTIASVVCPSSANMLQHIF